ncbi:MAG: DMT family transporter, partial [Bacteroidales bacterium]|nr:DMT family transporter [Bacteroidales bacterium]
RFLLAFLMLAGWQAAKDKSAFKLILKPPLLLIVATLALSWNYISFMMGIHYTTPSNAQLFIQFGPILLALAGLVFFRERINRLQIVGFGIAFLGMAFFYRDQLLAFFDVQKSYNLGVAYVLTSAVAWATYAILQKKLVVKHSTESLNLFTFGLPIFLYMPFVNFGSLLHINWVTWLLLLFVGLNTLFSYTFLSMALKNTEANKVSVIIIINPVITFITMGILTHLNVSWIEHERFSVFTILGAFLVLFGAILVAKKQKVTKEL